MRSGYLADASNIVTFAGDKTSVAITLAGTTAKALVLNVCLKFTILVLDNFALS
jgi:hypothetical protein